MKKVKKVVPVLLLCICILCTGCAERQKTELEDWIGPDYIGVSFTQIQALLKEQGVQMTQLFSAGETQLYDVYALQIPSSTVHGYTLQPGSNVLLRFTPAFQSKGGMVEPLFAGVQFTVIKEESAAFLRWMYYELRDCTLVPEQESNVAGEEYIVRCYSELTAREYTAAASLTRQSRAKFGSETSLPTDTLATLPEQFAEHLAAVRQGKEVPMCEIILRENSAKTVTVSVEAYGEALYYGKVVNMVQNMNL